MFAYHSPRLIEPDDNDIRAKGVRLLVRLEYENHATIKGNKWWKLKYNIEEAVRNGHDTLLTFGGAYSNHIYATAAAAHEAGLNSIGIIRGEKVSNPVLQFAEKQKMQLVFVSREEYQRKDQPEYLQQLRDRYNNPYIIPEGGTNTLALKGCAEWASILLEEHSFDFVFLAVGTAGTMSGLVCGLEGTKKVVGVSVLKDGAFLETSARQLMHDYCGRDYGNWNVLTSYHHGGYARSTKELENFMTIIHSRYGIRLDHVYTGKMMYALYNEILSGKIARGTSVLALHTGGF